MKKTHKINAHYTKKMIKVKDIFHLLFDLSIKFKYNILIAPLLRRRLSEFSGIVAVRAFMPCQISQNRGSWELSFPYTGRAPRRRHGSV